MVISTGLLEPFIFWYESVPGLRLISMWLSMSGTIALMSLHFPKTQTVSKRYCL